jgi:hypothetical protein
MAGGDNSPQLPHYGPGFFLVDLPRLFQLREVLPDRLQEDLAHDHDSFHIPTRLDENAGFAHAIIAFFAHPEGLLERVLNFGDELLDILAVFPQHYFQVFQQQFLAPLLASHRLLDVLQLYFWAVDQPIDDILVLHPLLPQGPQQSDAFVLLESQKGQQIFQEMLSQFFKFVQIVL